MTLLLTIAKSGTAIVFATHDFILYNKYPARTLKFENGKISELN
jgi:ABC-type ATPase involved in cell division